MDTGSGLACTGSCVEFVNSINALVDRNIKIGEKQKGGGYLGALFLGTIGVIFLVFGLSGVNNASLPISMGIGTIVFAIVFAVRTFTWPKVQNQHDANR